MTEMAVIEPRELKTSGKVTLLFHDPAAGRVGPMRVFAFLPPAATRKELTSLLFVVHGVRRNAEDAFQQALSAVDCHNCVLLVPEFSTQHFPGIWGFNYGNIADGEEAARLRPREQWAFSAIDGIFAAVTDAAQLNLNPLGFNIFGHSAGAQFVHRYVAFINSSESLLASHAAADACAVRPSPMLQAFAANAGSYMLPDFEQGFPFGLGGLETHFSRHTLVAFVEAPLTILLGADDTDPYHKHLPQQAAAQTQGEHRVARGQYFFRAGQTQAAALGVQCGWKLEMVAGTGHDGGQVSIPAVVLSIFRSHDNRAMFRQIENEEME